MRNRNIKHITERRSYIQVKGKNSSEVKKFFTWPLKLRGGSGMKVYGHSVASAASLANVFG